MTVISPLKTVYALFTDANETRSTTAAPNLDRNYSGQGIVSETISPSQCGRVQFQGSWWYAFCEQNVTLMAGEVVRVIGRHNITLLVQPI